LGILSTETSQSLGFAMGENLRKRMQGDTEAWGENFGQGAMLALGAQIPVGSASSGAGPAGTADDIVYRVIRPDENPAAGLFAKNPAATYLPDGHIINGSRPGWQSQFISTTKELSVAEAWAAKSGNRIVAIDLRGVSGKVYDFSTGAGLRGLTARRFAGASAEVLIEGSVPSSAIKWIR
jgi:hypothetical protein